MSDIVISIRESGLAGRWTTVVAAMLAAEVAGQGFRATDVRFWYHLVSNWIEADRLIAEREIELTQVRRVLERLLAEGWAEREGRSWRLTHGGVVGLAEALTDPGAPRRFEETLLVAFLIRAYRDALLARVRGTAAERRLAARFEMRRFVTAERRRLDAVALDLEARVRDGERLEAVARAAADPVSAIERAGMPYQLHPMRAFRDVLAPLPPALCAFETGPAYGLRARALFAPLAAQVRAQSAALSSLLPGSA